MYKVKRKIFSPAVRIPVQFCCLNVCVSVFECVGLVGWKYVHYIFWLLCPSTNSTLFAVSIKAAFVFPTVNVKIWREVSKVEKC